MAKRRGRPPYDDQLTPAEWRTVHAIRHGLTNREIASRRSISVDAVKFHVANAIAKLGVENRKALRNWRGVPKNSALNVNTDKTNKETQIIGVGQIARTVRDISRAVAWYRDVVGLTHLYTFDALAFFDCGGVRLMLSQVENGCSEESLIYLRVIDIDSAYEKIKSRGAKFISAPHMIHMHDDGIEEWMAFFDDPEGRPLAIMSSADPGL